MAKKANLRLLGYLSN